MFKSKSKSIQIKTTKNQRLLHVFRIPYCKIANLFSLYGVLREGLVEKERIGKNGELWDEKVLRGLVFFVIQNPSNLEDLKKWFKCSFDPLSI